MEKIRAPLMLPWLAKSAGVSLPRAEELWRKACTDVAARISPRDVSPYWGAVKERMLVLLDAEVLLGRPDVGNIDPFRWVSVGLTRWQWLSSRCLDMVETWSPAHSF